MHYKMDLKQIVHMPFCKELCWIYWWTLDWDPIFIKDRMWECTQKHFTLRIFVAMVWIFQAVCDASLHFVFLSIPEPLGGHLTRLLWKDLNPFIPIKVGPWFVYLRCHEYTVHTQMLVLFTGSSYQRPSEVRFNYILSQYHTQIDVSFGLLTNKCQVLQSLFITSIPFSSKIIMTIPRLQKFLC